MSPTRKARFKRHYVGLRPWTRHSLVLMVAGCVYIAYGVSLGRSEDTEARTAALELALRYLSTDGWSVIWVMAGTMAIISSRWPPVVETWGYMALTGLSAGWSAVYLLGPWFGDAPSTNYTGAIVWGLVAFLWWAISGLLNPDHTGVVTDGQA